MTKHLQSFLALCAALVALCASAEGWSAAQVAPRLREGLWPASWIVAPGCVDNRFCVCHFRKNVQLDSIPERFVVHVSADSRYKLFVNGRFAGLGPACSDVLNWSFETLDLAPLLRKGRNTIAAVAWDFASHRPLAQMSFGRCSFLLQGATEAEEIIDTDSSWLCLHDKAYAPFVRPVSGYYAAGACEQLTAAHYPWGWEHSDYDDSGWEAAVPDLHGALKGAVDYPGRQLVPTPVRSTELTPAGTARLRRSSGIDLPAGFPAGTEPFTVPEHSRVELLLDNDVLMTGYPQLRFSGGRGAEIEIGYAEALFDRTDRNVKGNRNVVEGKEFIGYADLIAADGGAGRTFTPLWWRTWRYLRLRIETAGDPLRIEELRACSCGYPLVRESRFEAPEFPEAATILETGWRTARLCAGETYMDCPYYEQLQYFGDARIQAMITLYNTRNDELVRNALEQGRRSIVPDGITASRYPSSLRQFIPSFSLWWICMAHDYWRYRGGEEFLQEFLPGIRSVLAWFERYRKPDGSLGRIPFWFFMDWSSADYGMPPREPGGDSSVQDLQYLLTLDAAAAMERAFGLPALAEHYAAAAAAIRRSFFAKYYDPQRGLFADTPARTSYSQHANVLAILADIVSGAEATALFDRLEADTSLLPCTIYFRYYLQLAMKRAGRGDRLLDRLQPWYDQLALGLTTWAEQPEPSRSDCHAWGASPNIEFFRILLGIDSDAPGFRKVRIEPALGRLHKAAGEIPHPAGRITVAYERTGTTALRARIELPEGIAGCFCWHGREYPLAGGVNLLTAE